MSNLSEKLSSMPTDAVKTKYVKGKKAIVLSDSTGSSTPVGTEVILDKVTGSNVYYKLKTDSPTVSLKSKQPYELKLDYSSTRQELTERLSDIKKEEAVINSKLAFLNENGIDEFSDEEFKVYEVLSIIDNTKTSKLEKAKAIAALIKK